MKRLSEIQQLENWLTILLNTYKEHPSIGLAKIIHYYIERVISHDDFELTQPSMCHYFAMRKYWRWYCKIN